MGIDSIKIGICFFLGSEFGFAGWERNDGRLLIKTFACPFVFREMSCIKCLWGKGSEGRIIMKVQTTLIAE